MLLIFGMRNRAHQHGPCVAASCPRCHNEVVLSYLVVTRWFTLFFVPLIPFGRRRMLICPICSWQRQATREAEPLALEMIGITARWQAHELADDEYARRVDAFWTFVSPDANATHPSDQTPGSPPAPPAPPPGP